jgi:hypothetical protein
MRFDYLYGCQLASRQIAGPRLCALAAPPPSARGAENFYGAHITQSQRIYQRYTKEQLELLLEFVRGGRELNENQAVLLEAENRARGAPLRPPKPKPKPKPEPEPEPKPNPHSADSSHQ